MEEEASEQDVTRQQPLHIVTPTVHSTPLSKCAGFEVYLKLENLQIPGSFKIRGVGNLCQKVCVCGIITILLNVEIVHVSVKSYNQ